jgi:hypothetical protein
MWACAEGHADAAQVLVDAKAALTVQDVVSDVNEGCGGHLSLMDFSFAQIACTIVPFGLIVVILGLCVPSLQFWIVRSCLM